jgi:hypothetical protein
MTLRNHLPLSMQLALLFTGMAVGAALVCLCL